MKMSRERIGAILIGIGGMLLIGAGLWYLKVIQLPTPPKMTLWLLGVGFLIGGAYLITRDASYSPTNDRGDEQL
ncbi:MAG: hypothetical protein ABEI52_09385 [Halobacteriaceae archaeon]